MNPPIAIVRVKARKVVAATRRLVARAAAYEQGNIHFADLDASVHGWVNHVRYAESHGLRRHVLGRLRVHPPGLEPADDGAQ